MWYTVSRKCDILVRGVRDEASSLEGILISNHVHNRQPIKLYNSQLNQVFANDPTR